jgi:hypothetical protein
MRGRDTIAGMLLRQLLAVAASGCLLSGAVCIHTYAANETNPPANTASDPSVEKAIADFAKKQEALNWPEKFERIGTEMGVPPDVLAAVAFASTRWDHLQWPAGEGASPGNGMPHPYGIMGLWDNEHFGHNLLEAAQSLNKSPEDLKKDPELNIRGAAALLKKLYQDNPKPPETTEQDIESWRYAIARYSGLPEREFAAAHAVGCYEQMNQGYNEFGMHWKPHPVKLDAMRAELKKIKEEGAAKKDAPAVSTESSSPIARPVDDKSPAASPAQTNVSVAVARAVEKGMTVVWVAIAIVLTGLILLMLARAGKRASGS